MGLLCSSAETQICHRSYIIAARVILEKISCNFGTLLFYTLISSNTTLRYMFAQGILENHLELTLNAWVADIRTNGPSD
jgi:hypothetical protein